MREENTKPPIGQRNLLEEEPFEYQVFKDQRIQISYKHKPVMKLKGSAATDLVKKLERADGKEK